MKATTIACLVLLCCTSAFGAEEFPEIPEGPLEKRVAWRILDQQWRIIEPKLFTEMGKKYIGRSVRFNCRPIGMGKPLIVRTSAGTKATVSHIPRGDMDLMKELRAPKDITVEGILTAIDPGKRSITIKGFGIRPGH